LNVKTGEVVMQKISMLRNTQIIILGVCIAAATIASSVILSKGMLRVMQFNKEVIDVTGSAEKEIVSDYIVWNGAFDVRDPELKTAYSRLQKDLETVKKYLLSQGVLEDELVVDQVSTRILYKKNEKGHDTNEIEGYLLRQTVEVRSKDVQKVSDISRQVTELIDKGIQFISGAPEYFYTKLAELKIEMLAMATADAKERAMSMANSAGNKIGLMRSAKMGVFQITPVNSYEVSWYGRNDTSSLEKKVMAVVSASFAIE
jgi:uncharacterized protein